MTEKFEIKNKWIRIGTHLFDIEDMKGCWIQKNHLIIELEFKHDNVVYHFKDRFQCENAFNELCESKEAIVIEANADYNPDIMKTFYGDQFDREIKMMRCYEIDRLKIRHQKKLDKLIQEVEQMKKIIGKRAKDNG